MAAPRPGELVIGEAYFTVKCSACAKVIPLGPNPLGLKGFSGDGTITVGCPFCGTTAEYPTEEIATRELREMPPTLH